MDGLTKNDLNEMALAGVFSDEPRRFTFNGKVIEVFDDGQSPGLMAVEIWHGERLGNPCYVSSYPDGTLFVPAANNATNGTAIGAPCEFCGDLIDSIGECDKCGAEIHEQCLDGTIEHGTVCPYCYDEATDPVVIE